MAPELESEKWLPEDEAATERQIERLRDLAANDDIGEKEKAMTYVEKRIQEGLSQQAAWDLIGTLGARIARTRRERKPAPAKRELSL